MNMMMVMIGGVLLLLLLLLVKVMMLLLMMLLLLLTPLRGPVRSLIPSTGIQPPVPAESCSHAAAVVAPGPVDDRSGPGLLCCVKGARAHREALMLVDGVMMVVVVVPGQRHRVRSGAASVADGVFHEGVHVGAAASEQGRRRGPRIKFTPLTPVSVRAQSHSSMGYSSRDVKDRMIKSNYNGKNAEKKQKDRVIKKRYYRKIKAKDETRRGVRRGSPRPFCLRA